MNVSIVSLSFLLAALSPANAATDEQASAKEHLRRPGIPKKADVLDKPLGSRELNIFGGEDRHDRDRDERDIDWNVCDVQHERWVGDGYCDRQGGYNTPECAWDGGDCCPGTCKSGDYSCGHVGYDCKDPRGPRSCDGQPKYVKIYKFQITDDCDSGPHGEHQLQFDGSKYYPTKVGQCSESPTGYCEWREGLVHNVDGDIVKIDNWKSLTVGTIEHDDWSANDSYSTSMESKDWYINTCNTYEVRMSVDFEEETARSQCWSIEGTRDVGATFKNGVKISAGGKATFKDCSSWTEPAKSFVWFLKVSSTSD